MSPNRPSFHSIRALSAWLYGQAGYAREAVQIAMAHTDAAQTAHYQAGHDVEWTDIDLTLPASVIGGRGF